MLTRMAIAIAILTLMCSSLALAAHVEIDEHGVRVKGIGDIVSVQSRAHPRGSLSHRHDGRDREGVGSVVIEKGDTVRDASAVNGDLIVKGHVTRDATAVGGNVVIESTGRVDGDAAAVGGKVITKPGGALGGDTTSIAPNLRLPHWAITGWWMSGWLWILGGTVLYALLSAILVALFPTRTEIVASAALERPGWSLIYAICGILLIVPVMVLLILTILGIPLIAVEFLLIAAAWVFGSVAVALAVGQRLSAAVGRPIASAVLAAVVGTLVLGVVRLLPFAGDLLVGILGLFGFGAVLLTGFGAHPDWFPRRFGGQRQAPPPPVPPAPPTPPYGPGTDVQPA